MSREIKFRGHDGDEWYYGSHVLQDNTHFIYFNDGPYIRKEIEAKSLGQYTGLKDKNGKEIYEGDVVKVGEIPDLQNVLIEDVRYMDLILYHHQQRKVWLEIIGNIYQNPELLNA